MSISDTVTVPILDESENNIHDNSTHASIDTNKLVSMSSIILK